MSLRLSSEERSILIDGLELYGIHPDDSVISRLDDYTSLVRDWSTRINLVSLRDCDRFVEYHLLDSLKTAVCADYTSMHRILDFGSGAGLPGIPLAIVYPNLDVTLLDSRLKRSVFLEHAVSSLPVKNAVVVRNRIEELPAPLNVHSTVSLRELRQDCRSFYILRIDFFLLAAFSFPLKGRISFPNSKLSMIPLRSCQMETKVAFIGVSTYLQRYLKPSETSGKGILSRSRRCEFST